MVVVGGRTVYAIIHWYQIAPTRGVVFSMDSTVIQGGHVPESTSTSSSSFGTAGFATGVMGCILRPPIVDGGERGNTDRGNVGSANVSLL